MSAKQNIVIVGAGVGAASAADTLRENGYDGRLIMIGAEADLPYNRPELSKERLRREVTDEQALLHPADYYHEHDVELMLEHRVSHVSIIEKHITFADNTTLQYDRLLLATGARVRRLNAPGGDLEGIYYLHSLHDCAALSEALKGRPRVLVVGTGFIGCEVAASARTLGCEVTLVGRTPPLAHVLGEEIGDIYSEYHRAQGIDLKIGSYVERFEGNGRLERAVLFDGTAVSCDVAVVGIGVTPALEILAGEPIRIEDGGIPVDEFGRSSVPGVFAAGDVALSWNPRYAKRLRVEHFDNAQRQAVVAAKAMLGPTDPYNPIPSFWSDQFSYSLQYRGHAPSWDSIVYRGDRVGGSFSAFYMASGILQAVCSVNRYKENTAARRFIGKQIDPGVLANDGINLKEYQKIES